MYKSIVVSFASTINYKHGAINFDLQQARYSWLRHFIESILKLFMHIDLSCFLFKTEFTGPVWGTLEQCD